MDRLYSTKGVIDRILKMNKIWKPQGNYSGMLIGLSIAILYFLERKITAE